MASQTVEARGRRTPTRWVAPSPADEQVVDIFCRELGLPRVVSRLLVARGQLTVESAKLFLRPRREQLHDPFEISGMRTAVERLARAARAGETVLVHGDYDVDGMCSTTILTRTLRRFGARVVPFIPLRLRDGYDLSFAGVTAAIEANATVVLTCDCGTTAREPVAALCARGIDVIVTDHHLPTGPLPDCLAIINPRKPDCEYPDKDLAAVGLAFKLSLALAATMGQSDGFVWEMLDLVALATVADIAPLRGENRVLVRYGLKLLANPQTPGLRALIRAAGLEGKPITAGRLGYVVAPRLNAAGRLGHALRGVELLLTEDAHTANVIARELEELNLRRQELDRRTLDEALEMAAALDLDETYGIVLARDGWHPGVIGIVASRVVERFGRPTILIALEGGEGKGSGRSISPFDLHGALLGCSDLLVRFGGHRAAAGVTIAADRVVDFAERFNGIARARLTPSDLVPEIRVDLEVALGDLDAELESFLQYFEPHGAGNPSPVLVARRVRVADTPRVIGKDGLKFRIAQEASQIDAIGWGLAPRVSEISAGATIDIAFRLERDDFRNEMRLQAKIADFTPVD